MTHKWARDRRPPPIVVKQEDGRRIGIYPKHRDAAPPEHWDVCTPCKRRPGWVIYIVFLGILLWGLAFLALGLPL